VFALCSIKIKNYYFLNHRYAYRDFIMLSRYLGTIKSRANSFLIIKIGKDKLITHFTHDWQKIGVIIYLIYDCYKSSVFH
jgi:hypothetical protein